LFRAEQPGQVFLEPDVVVGVDDQGGAGSSRRSWAWFLSKRDGVFTVEHGVKVLF
jgi:hypothetical protein